MSKKNILFVNGIPDNRFVIGKKIVKNGKVIWEATGSALISRHLDSDLFQRSYIVFDTRQGQELPRQMIHGVFNEISDPDSHKISLQKAEDFYTAVSAHVPFFNIPSHVMRTTRDNISRLLQGIDKLHVPKTVRIQPKTPSEIHEIIKKEGLMYPVIFRQAGDHGGISTIRVDDEAEQFYAFALDGRDYYLTQYVEYVEDGLYKKYRLIVIDGEVYLRHLKISAGWMVHHKSQIKNPEKLQKIVAKRFASEIKPQIQQVISEIYRCLELDFFGVDCYIDQDMNLLVFEVNPSMGALFHVKGEVFSNNVDKIRKAVIKMIDSRIAK